MSGTLNREFQPRTVRRWLALGLLTFALSFRAGGQYAIDWFTIDSGGGTSANGAYSVSGTIGQPDAGLTMTGGRYALTGGFWSLIAAAQTPGAPRLTIRLVGTDTAVIVWPLPSAGFVLQQNSDLNTTDWVDTLLTPTDDGTNKSVVINPTAGYLFFRLQK